MGISKPIDSLGCRPKKEETIPEGSKDAPGIKGDDRLASLSSKRGGHKSDARCNGNVIPRDSRKDAPGIGQKIPGGNRS